MTTYPLANRTAQWFSDDYGSATFIPIIGVIHSTETMGWPGYDGGAKAPNDTAKPDFVNKKVLWRAHYEDNESSRALQNLDGGVETNTARAVQVELIGTCDPKHRTSWNGQGIYKAGVHYLYLPDAPDWYLQGIADWVAWMYKRWGLKMVSPLIWKSYPDSYGADSNRMTLAEWRAFFGWCGHQHVPENAHGDPGNFNMARVLTLAKAVVGGTSTATPTPAPTTQEWYLMADIPASNLAQIADAVLDAPIEHPTLKTADGKPVFWSLRQAMWSSWYYDVNGYNTITQVLKEVQGDDFDEVALAKTVADLLKPALQATLTEVLAATPVDAEVDPEQIANAVVHRLGQALQPHETLPTP